MGTLRADPADCKHGEQGCPIKDSLNCAPGIHYPTIRIVPFVCPAKPLERRNNWRDCDSLLTTQRKFSGATLAAVAALAVSSCTYNPYYNTTAGYYGHGYGYGGTRFSTGAFIGTGNSRWGYDPYVRAYYDYDRRAYYDPYLYGYYPSGYRPVVVQTVPHPYGWRPGITRIAPPNRVTSITLQNYHDRYGAYRRSDLLWARQDSQPPRYSPSQTEIGRTRTFDQPRTTATYGNFHRPPAPSPRQSTMPRARGRENRSNND